MYVLCTVYIYIYYIYRYITTTIIWTYSSYFLWSAQLSNRKSLGHPCCLQPFHFNGEEPRTGRSLRQVFSMPTFGGCYGLWLQSQEGKPEEITMLCPTWSLQNFDLGSRNMFVHTWSLHSTFTTSFFVHLWNKSPQLSHVEFLYIICHYVQWGLGEVIVNEVTKHGGFSGSYRRCQATTGIIGSRIRPIPFQPLNSVRIGQICNCSIIPKDAKTNIQIMKTPGEMDILSHSYIKIEIVPLHIQCTSQSTWFHCTAQNPCDWLYPSWE